MIDQVTGAGTTHVLNLSGELAQLPAGADRINAENASQFSAAVQSVENSARNTRIDANSLSELVNRGAANDSSKTHLDQPFYVAEQLEKPKSESPLLEKLNKSELGGATEVDPAEAVSSNFIANLIHKNQGEASVFSNQAEGSGDIFRDIPDLMAISKNPDFAVKNPGHTLSIANIGSGLIS